ncbi:putative DNA-binding protein ESCAROLA [Platanthera guangdongensis]|uniref:DNA-binding protein ESCAROLA n=1 Tax=Platanthera guangdongensis TaxID=2320717 RepID=A0ABR2LYE6_9ASPA
MAEYDVAPAVTFALSQPCDEEPRILRRSGGGASEASGSNSIIVRKPRGRPPGSKNKPKPPIVITRESESTMQPLVLELAHGSDVLDSVAAFARRRRVGVSILAGNGVVTSVSLRQPVISSAAFTISGRYDILSLSGTILPPPPGGGAAPLAARFTISVAGARGEVIGGAVAGPVTAAGTVVLVAASFLAVEFLQLPEEAEDEGSDEPASATRATAMGPGRRLTSQLSHDMVLWASPSSCRSFYPSSPSRPPSHY